MNEEKNVDVKYLSKDFKDFRSTLINFAKSYFPDTYTDFNTTSPGMMFIEMAAYVGDVLSYYIDDQIQELFLLRSEQRENLVHLSQAMGYKPKVTTPAVADIDVFIVIPSLKKSCLDCDEGYTPDWRYALNLNKGLIVKSISTGTQFIIPEEIDFSLESSYEEKPEVSVYKTATEGDEAGYPTYFLLKKTVKGIASNTKTEEIVTPINPEKYWKLLLTEDNIVYIESVVDSDGYSWYEVPYLAQDTIFKDEPIESFPDLEEYIHVAPYLLQLQKVPRRFITRIRSDNKTELHFGAGISSNPDEIIIPNPTNVGNPLPGSYTLSNTDELLDPANFLKTKAYGQVPYDTTLSVTYKYGGGIESNVPANDLTQLYAVDWKEVEDLPLDDELIQEVKDSLAVNNPEPGSGGRGADTVEEIRQNTLAWYGSQNRCVTKEDYIGRVYAMPQKYGSVAKAYITQDSQLNNNYVEILNPLALNLYVLGYDCNKYISPLATIIKENLQTYLQKFRILTDAINILDAQVVNVGIDFEIMSLSNYNKNEVLLRCINAITDFFDIDNWQINQPIIKADLITELMAIKGVRNVNGLSIVCKFDEIKGYSGNWYDIKRATKKGVIYPSLDPMIFELKYPNIDIRGKSR